MNSSVILIGFGNIGFRHFQSIKNDKDLKKIYIVDKNKKKILFYKKKYRKNKKLIFFTKIPKLSTKIEFAIIATCSKNTYEVFRELVALNKISFILFEKLISYEKRKILSIKKILVTKKIKGYLNLPRKLSSSYFMLKKLFKNSIIDYQLFGSTNLASNLIHQIDIFLHLASSKKIVSVDSVLEQRPIKSKREGYFEFQGLVKLQTRNKSKLLINDSQKTSKNFLNTARIENDRYIVNIYESINLAIIFDKIKLEVKKINFSIPFQSQLTSFMLKNIHKNLFALCKFDDAAHYHLVIIELFNNFLKKFKKKLKDFPIT